MKGLFFLDCCRYVGIMYIPIHLFLLYTDLSLQIIALTQSLWHTIQMLRSLAPPGGMKVQKEVKN